MGGCIVDSGKFDWMAHADKFPGLTTPDESYHGITYAEKFGLGRSFYHQVYRPAHAGLRLHPVPPERLLAELWGWRVSMSGCPATVRTPWLWRSFLKEQP